MADHKPRDFGPYVLDKLISAEGGQGMVYLATHKALERRVVIKILKDHLAKHDSFVDRFAAEASQLAKMDHANIVRVRQSGPMGDVFYIEMEYIEGWDLSTWLKEHGRLPVEIAVIVLQRFAAGLQHAHERSIIHRDVKPGNVMLTAGGEVKVLDFGLSRDLDESARVSTPGTLMGTYAYMSPQQVDGEEATLAFDVYSLGVVAYQLLSNKIPFEGTIATVCMKIKNEEPAPLEKLCPEAPRDLVKLIQRMMAKKTSQRPRDMREVEEGLRDVARQLGIRTSEDLLQRYVADPDAALQQMARRRMRRRWRPVALLAGAALAVVAVALVVSQQMLRPRHPAVPAAVRDTAAAAESLAAVARAPAAAAIDSATTARAALAALAAKRAADSLAALAAAAPAGPDGTVPLATGTPVPGTVTPGMAPGNLTGGLESVSTAWSADSIVVEIQASPASDLYLDGVQVAAGATHWIKRVVRKSWTVRAENAEYGSHEQKKKPRGRDTMLGFQIDLTIGTGGVYVSGPRDNLDVYLDGAYQHVVTPSPVRPIKVGPHLVEVRDRRTGAVLGSKQIAVTGSANNLVVDFSAGH